MGPDAVTRSQPSSMFADLDFRLSTMYAFVRQRKDGNTDKRPSINESATGKDTYKAYKCKYIGVALDPKLSNRISQFGCTPKICWK